MAHFDSDPQHFKERCQATSGYRLVFCIKLDYAEVYTITPFAPLIAVGGTPLLLKRTFPLIGQSEEVTRYY